VRNYLTPALLGAVGLALAPACATAQVPPPSPPPAPPATQTPAAEATPACCVVPAGTVVELEVTEAVSTKTHKRGDKFGLRLAAPIVIDGKTLAAEGAVGAGEVVHAAKAGMAGKAAELIVAGRYLNVQGVIVPLRGFNIAVHSKSQTDEATAAVILVGVVGLLVKADEIQVTRGAQATAKVATAVTLPPPPPPAAANSPSTSTGDVNPS